ncbi:TetR/AcrR family transcriptional regulator [Enhygromyxa salina]|uniref:TetR/AcrR family transcriptional regulator n=1 Tax=Enhygromyxa salina TaxID=215803 RepID=UPI00069859EA|nr:TetR/AcrR family transcriptional regulator [Enhygromyxa salina]
MSEPATKERILDAAEQIMLERSFGSVGLNQILTAVKVPKGSFYHYFDSKEQFGVEMLKHYSKTSNAQRRKILLESEVELAATDRLIAMFTSVMEEIEKSGCKCPCLMQKLAAEVSSLSDAMREALSKGFKDTIFIFQQTLDLAVSQGDLPAGFDTASEADFIMDLWSGSQQRTVLNRDVAPMRRAIEIIRQRLSTAS